MRTASTNTSTSSNVLDNMDYRVSFNLSQSDYEKLRNGNNSEKEKMTKHIVSETIKSVEWIIADRQTDAYAYYGPTEFNHFRK